MPLNSNSCPTVEPLVLEAKLIILVEYRQLLLQQGLANESQSGRKIPVAEGVVCLWVWDVQLVRSVLPLPVLLHSVQGSSQGVRTTM